jgi:hypothetical protein
MVKATVIAGGFENFAKTCFIRDMLELLYGKAFLYLPGHWMFKPSFKS